MSAVFQLERYHFDSLSLPFIGAGAVLVMVAVYVALMRGAPVLRAALLVIAVGLLPFVASYALVASTTDPQLAVEIYRLGLAPVPMAAAGVLLFLLALSHQLARYRTLVTAAFVASAVMAALSIFTDLVVDQVWETPSGLLYFHVRLNGIAQLHPLMIGGWVVLGVVLVWRKISTETSAIRRHQLRGSVLAFSVCALGLVDVPLAYQIGWYPFSWLALIIGFLLAFRLFLTDDLLRVEAVDQRVTLMFFYATVAVGTIWLVLDQLGTDTSIGVVAALLVGVFIVLRIAIALTLTLVQGPAPTTSDTPLERAVDQYAQKVQSLDDEGAIGAATAELIALGLGCERTELLVPSRDDYSWERVDAELTETLPESATPDPLILGWILEHGRPLARDELELLRLDDLRGSVERLFDSHGAEILVPLISQDEIVGMLAVGAQVTGRALRREERHFLERLQEQAASALVYCRMQREATTRVAVDKEVGLAAAVQAAFVPKGDVVRVGDMSFAGVYEPASRCGGDWWSVHELPGERVLVLIGDVTGHGIAAAMVTAAAKGCYDVAQRLMGADLDVVRLLDLLDGSVRRAGGDQFYMTCFATLLDPSHGEVTYANAGHVVPYLCRPRSDGRIELDALVARGNPLGAADRTEYQAITREIASGDIVVWYTDGIVECTNPQRKQFGDRRMQRLLRKISGEGASVQMIRNGLVRAAVAFQEGQPPDDDITLVVGKIE